MTSNKRTGLCRHLEVKRCNVTGFLQVYASCQLKKAHTIQSKQQHRFSFKQKVDFIPVSCFELKCWAVKSSLTCSFGNWCFSPFRGQYCLAVSHDGIKVTLDFFYFDKRKEKHPSNDWSPKSLAIDALCMKWWRMDVYMHMSTYLVYVYLYMYVCMYMSILIVICYLHSKSRIVEI